MVFQAINTINVVRSRAYGTPLQPRSRSPKRKKRPGEGPMRSMLDAQATADANNVTTTTVTTTVVTKFPLDAAPVVPPPHTAEEAARLATALCSQVVQGCAAFQGRPVTSKKMEELNNRLFKCVYTVFSDPPGPMPHIEPKPEPLSRTSTAGTEASHADTDITDNTGTTGNTDACSITVFDTETLQALAPAAAAATHALVDVAGTPVPSFTQDTLMADAACGDDASGGTADKKEPAAASLRVQHATGGRRAGAARPTAHNVFTEAAPMDAGKPQSTSSPSSETEVERALRLITGRLPSRTTCMGARACARVLSGLAAQHGVSGHAMDCANSWLVKTGRLAYRGRYQHKRVVVRLGV